MRFIFIMKYRAKLRLFRCICKHSSEKYFLFAISILLGGGIRVAFKVFTEERGIGET